MSESLPGRLNRRAFIVVASVLASACIAAILAELAVAIAYPQPTWRRVRANTPAMFIASDTLPFRLRPGYSGRFARDEYDVSVRINSSGFRGPEARPRNSGRIRILGLGDSFTFGYGVEDDEAYAARTGSIIREQVGFEDAEFINAGFASGYAPDTYYLFTKKYGLALQPDLITVGVFVGNDVDGYRENRWVTVDREGLPTSIGNEESRVDEEGYFVQRRRSFAYSVPILRSSHLFHLVGTVFRRGQDLRRPPPKSPAIYDAVYDPSTKAAVTKAGRLLLAVDSIARQASVSVLIILIPTREQVLAANLQPSNTRDLAHPQRALREILDPAAIPVVDLLEPMRQSKNRDQLYFEKDQHWTPMGHEVAARYLAANILNARGLLRRRH